MTQLLGQALCGLIQAIFLNLPANVSAAWFPSQERDISTMFASISGPLGNALGSSMPAMFVNSTDSPSELDNHMALLLLIQFTMCLGVFLPTCIFFQSAPPTPPSESERLKRLAEDERERLVAGVENFGLKVEEDRKLTITSDDDRSGSQSGSRRSGGASNRLGSGRSEWTPETLQKSYNSTLKPNSSLNAESGDDKYSSFGWDSNPLPAKAR